MHDINNSYSIKVKKSWSETELSSFKKMIFGNEAKPRNKYIK